MPSRRRPLLKPKAIIGYLANENTSTQSISGAGREVIERVKKCFARANHENANEQEAKAASKMASKIMEQYSISQAEIMIHEDSLQRERRGGMSTVNIWPAKNGGRAFTPGWVEWLCGAMQNFFDCRSFSTGYEAKITWTFYGIAEHTVSAAIAFEAVHNQIQDWSEKYTGIPIRNSYCLGVADGLLKTSKDEKRATEERARQAETRALAAKIREEEEEEKLRLSRLRKPSLETVDELDTENELHLDDGDSMTATNLDTPEAASDGVSDDEVLPDFTERSSNTPTKVDAEADFDTELQRFIKRESHERTVRSGQSQQIEGDDVLPSTESDDEEADGSDSTVEWKSMRQLSTFREMSRDIEDKVLESHKLKLRTARKKKKPIRDRDAFKEGQKDSKKIDVRAARIEPGEKYEADPMDLD
ncbi:MAG: hypothetical protein Q9225_003360 [Loekoesia sp. 1 TL-2023]